MGEGSYDRATKEKARKLMRRGGGGGEWQESPGWEGRLGLHPTSVCTPI